MNCRSYANTYLRRGKLTKMPCEECGNEKSQMHHPDYDKPLEVVWLCRKCHLKHHSDELPIPSEYAIGQKWRNKKTFRILLDVRPRSVTYSNLEDWEWNGEKAKFWDTSMWNWDDWIKRTKASLIFDPRKN